jgi:hypothetical protein
MRFLLRAPRLTLLAVAIATMVFAFFAHGFRVDSAVDQLLPHDDPDRQYYNGARGDFGSEEISVVALFTDDVFDPEVLADVTKLTHRLARIDGVREVDSLSNLEAIEMADDGLGKRRLLPALPMSQEQRETFRRKATGHRVARKTIVSPDSHATGIVLRFDPMTDEEFLQRGIESEIRDIAQETSSGADVAITGLPTIKVHAARAMLQDLTLFVPLGAVVVSIVLWWAFRTWRGVFLPLSTVVIGVVWTAGAMVIAHSAFTMGTLVLPPLLIAVGIAYAIHVVSRYYLELRDDRTPPQVVWKAVEHVRLPVLMAAVTTLVSFASFLLSSIPSIRDFGLYCAFGITAILLASLVVVPAFLSLMAIPKTIPAVLRHSGIVARVLEACARFAMRRRRSILIATAVLITVSILGIGRIRVETDYLRFFSPSSPIRVDNARIGAALAGTQLITVIMDGTGPETATRLPAIEGLRRMQSFIDQQPGVDKTISLLDYIDMLREALDPGSGERPFDDQRMVDDLVLLLNPEDTRKTVNLDYSRSNLTVHTRLSGSAEVRELVERIENFGKDAFPSDYRVHVTGTVVLLNRSAVALAKSQITGLRNVFTVLFVIMLFLLGTLRLGLLSLVPNVLPAIVLFGIMGWAGIDLNISTCLIAVVAVGIAVDDTIHYLTTFGEEMRRTHDREAAILNTVRTVGRPILVTSIALSAGFLVVCLSNFQPIRHFGLLASVTMSVALLADLFLLPPLLFLLRIGDEKKESAT